MFVPRTAQETLEKLAEGYPVLAVNGPRQSGKTTLVRTTFPEKAYLSLEDLEVREHARTDPRGFLAGLPDGGILDEVQRIPELFSYLQGVVDEQREPGLFVLTGSQQFDLLAGISQSLAGRVALVPLLPFSLTELSESRREPKDLFSLLWTGLYPPIHDRGLDPDIWYGNYVATYVERDVRRLINVRDLSSFQTFLRLCAGRSGQLLNLSGLAADCGITHNTARAWTSVLEASFLVHLLRPHHANFSKRLVKTPKLYFHDQGLAAWLLGIRSPEQLSTHPLRGHLFEGWVISEMLKQRFHRGLRSNLFFWRDRAGLEVDALIDRGDELIPIEMKSGGTVVRDFFRGLDRWRDLAGASAGRGWLVFGGERGQVREEVEVLGWRDVRRLPVD